MSTERRLFSPREAEQLLSVSHAGLYRLLRSGQLTAVKMGGSTRITSESLYKFIDGLPTVKTDAEVA